MHLLRPLLQGFCSLFVVRGAAVTCLWEQAVPEVGEAHGLALRVSSFLLAAVCSNWEKKQQCAPSEQPHWQIPVASQESGIFSFDSLMTNALPVVMREESIMQPPGFQVWVSCQWVAVLCRLSLELLHCQVWKILIRKCDMDFTYFIGSLLFHSPFPLGVVFAIFGNVCF